MKRFDRGVSRYKLVARWVVAAILFAGLILQRPAESIALASVAYFVVEGHRVQSIARHQGVSISEMVDSTGWLLRRGFLWALIVLATLFHLLLLGQFLLLVVSLVLLYVAGLFSQASRGVEDEYRRRIERQREDRHHDQESRDPEF